jgi:hypothetical protein
MITNNKQEYRDFRKYLEDNKIPFEILYTNRTFRIKSGIGDLLYCQGSISHKGMGLINKVKSVVLKQDFVGKLNSSEYYEKLLKRMQFNRSYFDGKKYYDVVEFDLVKAYWVSAYKLGILPEDLYKEGLKNGYSKIEILACLGNFAKVKKSRGFNGQEYSKSKTIEDSSNTRFLWNAISYETDRCMVECANELGNDFILYWTDAVFFRDVAYNRELVANVMAKHGFEFKIKEIEYVKYDKSRRMIQVATIEDVSNAKNKLIDKDGFNIREFPEIKPNVKEELMELIEKFK